jgi:hypothetical protein
MTNMHKTRIGVAVILILAASVFFGIIKQDRGFDFFLGATPVNQGGRPIGSQSEHDRRSGSDSDRRGTRTEQTASSRVMEAEYRIQNAADSIILALEGIEAKNAYLISEVELERRYDYVFNVKPIENFDQTVAEFVRDHANEYNVDSRALKHALNRRLEEFDIPAGMLKKIQISVSKDPEGDVVAASGFQSPEAAKDLTNTIFPLRVEFRRFTREQSNWRYHDILDLNRD